MMSWRGVYFVCFLFLASFFGSVFMLGPFLPVMMVSPTCYRWLTDRIVATWLTLPVALLEVMGGAKVVITGDGFIPGERSVIIMNHRTRLDWMFLWNCLLRFSYLRLEKICLKSSLKSVPGFGWAMQVASFIFIRRKWEEDRSHFEAMLDYFCDIKEPLQLLFFPEGTDLTANTKSRSHEFAEKNALEKYEYVLHPRTTGFTFIVDRLREGHNLDAIHDITVAYPHNIPQTEKHILSGQFPREIHFHVCRYPVASLPIHKEDLQRWCQDRWREKEDRLTAFYEGHRYFDVSRRSKIPPCKSELRVHIIKMASLLYWTAFTAASMYSLYMYSYVRCYALTVVVFYVLQEKIFGGLELMELSCHRFHANRKSSATKWA